MSTGPLEHGRIARRVADELEDREQLAAERTAQLILDALKPGCGPMTVPAWAVDVFQRVATGGGYQSVQMLASRGGDVVYMNSWFREDGSLHLQLELNGQYRVWEGVLRGPQIGPP